MLRNVTFSDVDTTDEIAKEMNKIIDNVNLMESKVCQLDESVEAKATKGWVKKLLTSKKKGTMLMKTLVSLIVVIVLAVVCYAYVPTDINYDIASNPAALAVYLRDSFGNITSNSYLFTPTTTEPTAVEGKVYYNDTENKLKLCIDGTNYLHLDTAGGVSLDSAYDYGSVGGGRSITATDGAVAIASTDADTAFLLTLGANPGSSAALGGMEITCNSNSTEAAIEIENAGSGKDIEGTAGWTIDKAGAIVCVGITNNAGDVLFDDTYDLSWDTDRDQLLFEDNAILGIGGAHDAAGDVTFKWDATNLLIESAAEDTGEIRYGSTNAIDVVHYDNGATGTAKFNTSTSTLEFNAYDIQLQDDDIVAFGDSDDFEVYYEETTTDNLIFKTAAADDAVQIGDGTTGTDLKLMANTSGDYALWDNSADELYFEDADLKLNEGAQMEFCYNDNATDWTIDLATAERLTFTPSETDDTATFHIGTAANTSDFVVYMKTAGETLTMDASADSLTYVGDLALFTLTGTTLPFHADVTGTVAGEAAKLETTNGGITLLADGSANGDILIDAEDKITIVSTDTAADGIYIHANGGTSESIEIHSDQGTGDESILLSSDAGGITVNAAAGSIDIEAVGGTDGDIILDSGDDMTLTVAGDLTLAVTGTFAGGGATMDNFYSTTEVVTGTTDTLTAAQSGNMIIYTQTGGSCTVTLPEATSGTVGMWFILIDGNPSAGNDLAIDPEGGGQINGDTAGNKITCENDRDGEGVLIFSTAADVWYTMACGSSTVWTEE